MLARLRAVLPNLWYSVSATTRAPRDGEIDGVNYHFLTPEAFAADVAAGKFLEHAHFAGFWYGTPREAVRRQLDAGRDVLLEIEVQGARLAKADPLFGSRVVLIFLAPPSFDELARRLVGRGTEDAATRAQRLAAARAELAAEREFDHVVVNTDVDSAVAALVQLTAVSRSGSPVR